MDLQKATSPGGSTQRISSAPVVHGTDQETIHAEYLAEIEDWLFYRHLRGQQLCKHYKHDFQNAAISADDADKHKTTPSLKPHRTSCKIL